MSNSQVFVVDNVAVAAATEKLAQFKVAQNLKIEIDLIRPGDDDSSDLQTPSEKAKLDEHGNEVEKKKRRRRTAAQIDRKYTCTYSGCQKAYGSEGSLTQHMRLKHRNLSMAHRERANMVNMVFYSTAANNIAIRPALGFGMDASPFLSALTPPGLSESSQLRFPPVSPEDDGSPQKALRSRSNSMPVSSAETPASCATPQRKPATRRRTTTPTNARRTNTTTPRNLPRTTATRKKRSQSMSCSTPSHLAATPLLPTRMSDSSLSSTIEGLSLSPSYGYFQAAHPVLQRPPLAFPDTAYPYSPAASSTTYSPAYKVDDYSPAYKAASHTNALTLLSSLNWHDASATRTNSPESFKAEDVCMTEDNQSDASTNDMVLAALADYEASSTSSTCSSSSPVFLHETQPIPFRADEPFEGGCYIPPDDVALFDFVGLEPLPEALYAPAPFL
ncbi:hypothetical protein ACHHYP_01211 [Achlya hypogyna]|uniref:C2H2-type domain-containing protein n=1 Tax=Achlya hypogyna TaxID=1202772 RepID=A0A1V9Z920_ACHHY|nr:hypothetical protein ACHHYP_01211 [Achlya hypogyna]